MQQLVTPGTVPSRHFRYVSYTSEGAQTPTPKRVNQLNRAASEASSAYPGYKIRSDPEASIEHGYSICIASVNVPRIRGPVKRKLEVDLVV